MHLILRVHRFSRKLYDKNMKLLALVLYKLSRVVFSCDIKYTVDISPDVQFYHNALGVVIHPRSKIGKGTKIYQNVTLGGNGKNGEKNGPPIIGENVIIGAGAVVLGPIKVGNNAKIGANAVVLQDVPESATAIGVPAKIIKGKR